jgi:D-alanyl-D-alanine carboxypeptidase
LAAALVAAGTVSCGVPPDPAGLQPSPAQTSVPAEAEPAPAESERPTPDTAAASESPLPRSTRGYGATPRPAWLGTRVLSERRDGVGDSQPTPPELVDRRLPPPEPDPSQAGFAATVGPVPADVVARSTWTEACPVGLDELRYLTVPFLGFDGHTYSGEMIVHADVAADVAGIFEQLYEADFPIEEMRVVSPEELDAPPTGDGNNTTAFVCRATTMGSSWSEHAYGLAVDINPFHNPYVRDDIVIPELATAYTDRDRSRPGMIQPGDAVTMAFAEIGWAWGGGWRSIKDWMHFSRSGR